MKESRTGGAWASSLKQAKKPGEEDVFKICSARALLPSIAKRSITRREDICEKGRITFGMLLKYSIA